MAQELVGLRRLYRALGFVCPDPEIIVPLDLQPGLRGSFYIGKRPPLGLFEITSPKYIMAGPAAARLGLAYKKAADFSGGEDVTYVEMSLFATIEAPEDVSVAYHGKVAGSEAKIWSLLEPMRPAIVAALDLVAGSVGLVIHRQLVIELVNENAIAVRDEKVELNYVGGIMQVLDTPGLTEEGQRLIREFVEALKGVSLDSMQGEGRAFYWLLRAWPHQDAVNQFLAFFVPLEMILKGVTVDPDAEEAKMQQFVRDAVAKAAPEDQRSLYKSHLDILYGRTRPSLEQRFRILASRIGLKNWERDVEAFSRFNKIRNQLLHRGNEKVVLRVELSEETIRTLEDLVERYVCLSLFGHANVYPHRFRPVS